MGNCILNRGALKLVRINWNHIFGTSTKCIECDKLSLQNCRISSSGSHVYIKNVKSNAYKNRHSSSTISTIKVKPLLVFNMPDEVSQPRLA